MSDFGVANVKVQIDSRTVDRDVRQLLDGISKKVADVRISADARTVPRTIETAVESAHTSVTPTVDGLPVTKEIEGAVDAADTAVTPTVDGLPVTKEIEGAVDAADTNVVVTSDTTRVAHDITGAVDTADSNVVITSDATEITGDITAAVDNADTHVVLSADASGLRDASSAADEMAGEIGGAAAAAVGLKAALAGIGLTAIATQMYQAGQAASDMAESQSKSEQVFKESTATVTEFASTSATSMGLSTRAATEMAGTFGNLFTSMGTSREAAAQMSTQVLTLGSDLASFNNLGVDDTLDKIRSGLVGEIEPLRQLGVSFNAADVEAKGMQLGLADANGALDEGAKVQARLALITEQSSNAQGDFSRTSDGLANSQRTLKAEWDNAIVAIGTGFLPLLKELVTEGRDAIPAFVELATAGGTVLVDAFAALLPLMGTATTILTALTPLIEAFAQAIEGTPDIVLQLAGAFLFLNRATKFLPLLGGLGKMLGGLGGSAKVATTGVSSLGSALPGVATQAASGAAAGGLLSKSFFGISATTLAAAAGLFAVSAATAGYLRAQNQARTLEAAKEFAELEKVTRENVAATGLLNDAVRVSNTTFTASRSALQAYREDGKLTEQGLRDIRDGFDKVLEKAPELAQSYIDTARTAGVNRDQIKSMQEALDAKIESEAQAVISTDAYNTKVEEATVSAQANAEATQAQADALASIATTAPPVGLALDALMGPGGNRAAEWSTLALAIDQAGLSEEQLGVISTQLGIPLDQLQTNVGETVAVVEGFVSSVETAIPNIGTALSGLAEGFTFQDIRDQFALTYQSVVDFEANIALLAGFPNVQAATIAGGPAVAGALAQGFKDGKTQALNEMELQAAGTAQVQQSIIDAARDKYGPAFAAQLAALGVGGAQAFASTFKLTPAAQAELDATAGVYEAAKAPHATQGSLLAEGTQSAYAASLAPMSTSATATAERARQNLANAEPGHTVAGSATADGATKAYQAALNPISSSAKFEMDDAINAIEASVAGHKTAGTLTADGAADAYAAAIAPVSPAAKAAMDSAKSNVLASKPGMSVAGTGVGLSGSSGFKGGLRIPKTDVDNVVKNWRTTILGSVGAIFESSSPSKVMEREGHWVAEGFIKGIVQDQAKMRSIVAKFAASIGAAVGTGAIGAFGLQEPFASRLAALIRASGNTVGIGSGRRSTAQQAVLYARWLAGVPGQARAAPPGRSKHEQGLAADLTGNKSLAHRLAPLFGLRFPVRGEDWHIELGPGHTYYQRGAWNVQRPGFTDVGEMVLPRALANLVRKGSTVGAGRAGGGGVTVQIRIGNVYGATATDIRELGKELADPIAQKLNARKVRLAARVA